MPLAFDNDTIICYSAKSRSWNCSKRAWFGGNVLVFLEWNAIFAVNSISRKCRGCNLKEIKKCKSNRKQQIDEPWIKNEQFLITWGTSKTFCIVEIMSDLGQIFETVLMIFVVEFHIIHVLGILDHFGVLCDFIFWNLSFGICFCTYFNFSSILPCLGFCF